MLIVELPYVLPRQLVYRGKEQVALLVGSIDGDTYTVRNVVMVRNEHPDPVNHFSVSNEQARVMCGDVSRIIGALHTHAADRPEPSAHDLISISHPMIGGVVINRHVVSWYRRKEGVIDVDLRYWRNDALLYTA